MHAGEGNVALAASPGEPRRSTLRHKSFGRIITRYYFGATMAVSVTSKGQVTIPKRIREALGITPGSKVEFDMAGGGARLKLIKKHVSSSIEEGPAILDYKGPSDSDRGNARRPGD